LLAAFVLDVDFDAWKYKVMYKSDSDSSELVAVCLYYASVIALMWINRFYPYPDAVEKPTIID
jgi:hypothetical protein